MISKGSEIIELLVRIHHIKKYCKLMQNKWRYRENGENYRYTKIIWKIENHNNEIKIHKMK